MYIPKPIFDPDERGHFDKFGGRFVPETLMPALLKLEEEYNKIRFDEDFWKEVHYYLKDYVGRPSPLFFAKNISEELQAKIYLKREDLQIVRSYKIRGAYNFISNLSDQQKKKGVVAASAEIMCAQQEIES